MGISRRGFLKGIIAAAMAPAIVRAGSLMPVYVAKHDLVVPDQTLFDSGDYLQPTSMVEGFGDKDFTIEAWMRPVDHSEWKHVAQIQRDGHLECYIDGTMIRASEFEAHGFKLTAENGRYTIGFDRVPDLGNADAYFQGHLNAVRLTSVARDPSTLDFNQPPDLKSKSLFRIERNLEADLQKVNREVAKFESQVHRGIQSLDSFVDRADAVARQESPTGFLAAMLGRV